jgi:hypothetical protein
VPSVEYKGEATKTKGKEPHTETLSSCGDVVVTDAPEGFEELKGADGTYTLTLVCEGMPGERPKVGKPVSATFSAKGM